MPKNKIAVPASGYLAARNFKMDSGILEELDGLSSTFEKVLAVNQFEGVSKQFRSKKASVFKGFEALEEEFPISLLNQNKIDSMCFF